MGFNDSKQLKDSQRADYLDEILAHPSIGYVIRQVTSQEISEQMLKAKPRSLNLLSYDAVVDILEYIRDVSPAPPSVQHLYVDTVGEPGFYKSKILEAMGPNFAENVTIEKKADANYKVVGAASIIAKQCRDGLLERYKYGNDMKLDKNFGSGYPSDDKCAQWMKRSQHHVFGYPVDLVRFSWSTTRQIMKDRSATSVEWPCDEEENVGADISTFFGPDVNGTKSPLKKRRRTFFFNSRRMKHLTVAGLFNEFND